MVRNKILMEEMTMFENSPPSIFDETGKSIKRPVTIILILMTIIGLMIYDGCVHHHNNSATTATAVTAKDFK